jgi:hypothetical protein
MPFFVRNCLFAAAAEAPRQRHTGLSTAISLIRINMPRGVLSQVLARIQSFLPAVNVFLEFDRPGIS